MSIAASLYDLGRMDKLSRTDSPVHRLDARSKVLVTAVFIVIVMSFPRHEITALIPYVFFPVALVALGKIPVGFWLKKILWAMPFVLAVAIFNPILDRQSIWVGGHTMAGGWLSFVSILIRFLLTVGTALALVTCTGIYRLCSGLERLGIPRVFAVQLLLFYRYLFVIADEASRMLRGIEIRSPVGSRSLPLRVYGSLIGHLLLRSMDRALRIYRAMVSRGFEGEIHMSRNTPAGWNDVLFVMGWCVFFIIARVWNLSEWIGAILQRGTP